MQSRWPVFGIVETMLVASTVVSFGGCAGASAFERSALTSSPTIIESRGGGITLSVVNRNFELVRVYMLRGSMRMNLGTVEGFQTKNIRISASRWGSTRVLNLSMVTIPSRARIAMIPVDVEPGQVVEARVGTHVQNSSVHIRVPALRR